MRDYKVIKKGNKYYEQEENELNIDTIKTKLKFWKEKKERMIKEVTDECQPRIDELKNILDNLPN